MVRPVLSTEERDMPKAGTDPKFNYMSLVPAAVTIAGLYFGRPVLLPLAVSILLAFVLAPLVNFLRRAHIGHAFSVIFAAVLALTIVGGFIAFAGAQIVSLADDFPRYQSNITQKIQSIQGIASEDGVIARAAAALQRMREQVLGPEAGSSETRLSRAPQSREPIPVEVRAPQPAAWVLYTNIITSLLGPLGIAGLIAVFVVFILLYKEDLRDRFIRLAGARDIQRSKLLLDDSAERLSAYLLCQTAINAAFGVVVGTGLWLIGLPNPALWGASVMILRFVPYFGVPIAALLPLVVAMAVDPGWTMVLWTAVIFFGGEVIVGQAIEPWLFGRNIGLSAVAVVVSATFWTWLWGPLGLLLSTPLTTCLMVIGRHIEQLNFLEVLLGDRPALAAEESLYLRMLGEDADIAAEEAEDFLKENSLPEYYQEVVLKALALAQADALRGTLDREQAGHIRDTMRSLIQMLSDTAEPATEPAPEREDEVLCIAGRGPLDEAAALLLMHLLEEKGIGAKVVASVQFDAEIRNLDLNRMKTICICFLDPGNFVRARHLLNRIRRRIPGTSVIAAFWGFTAGNSRYPEDAKTLSCEIVTRLEETVRQIENPHPHPAHAARPAAPQPERLTPAGILAG
jgi:predicted PurR-regulated permease PerM